MALQFMRLNAIDSTNEDQTVKKHKEVILLVDINFCSFVFLQLRQQ